jgi:prepilin-type N-terminal cleavage/methylation domain-containing protein
MKKKGFSLVELAIVLGIIVIITLVVINNNMKYTTERELKTAAQDLTSDLKNAQIYARTRVGDDMINNLTVHLYFDNNTYKIRDYNNNAVVLRERILQNKRITFVAMVSGSPSSSVTINSKGIFCDPAMTSPAAVTINVNLNGVTKEQITISDIGAIKGPKE